jgi:hypothetical protein
MKKISLTSAIILLMVVLVIPVSAEPDYSITTPPQEIITFDEVDVPLGESVDIPDSEGSDAIEEIEIDLPPVPLGDMSVPVFNPGESVTPPVVPQTGDKMLTPIVLLITSVLGVGAATVFLTRRKTSKI